MTTADGPTWGVAGGTAHGHSGPPEEKPWDLPGHTYFAFDVTVPRLYTPRGGWLAVCQCGTVVGESGDADLDARMEAHLDALRDAM